MFSDDKYHRYQLWRVWSRGLLETKPGYVNFIMLNPSKADHMIDDPTIRRCMDYTDQWGYAQLCVTNLFAYRSTNPKALRIYKEPIGSDNDFHIKTVAHGAAIIVAGWGLDGALFDRAKQVLTMLDKVHALKLNEDGSPQHPLYLPKHLRPFPL